MRLSTALILALLPAIAIAGSYRETRNLEIQAAGILAMQLHCGAGSLKIIGVEGYEHIEAAATIEADGTDRDSFRYLGDKIVQLELSRENDQALLYSQAVNPPFSNIDVRIHLTVRLPAGMDLLIIDGSGAIDIININGNLSIDDDSGAISVHNITGRIRIEDGSGDIEVDDVRGDLEIIDGSGHVVVRHVSGNLTITDASGAIEVNDIGGSVTVSDGSGSIDIYRVQKNVFIREPGSGELEIGRVQGKVIIRE